LYKGVYKLESKSLRLGSNHAVQLSMPLPKRVLLFAAELGILLVGIVVAICMLAFLGAREDVPIFYQVLKTATPD
jgi:hypothetical protein